LKLDLSQQSPGPFKMNVKGNNTLTVEEHPDRQVWLCAGQSNMEFASATAPPAGADMKTATEPTIRLCMLPRVSSMQPLDDIDAKWVICSPKTIGQGGWWGFSAVGYYSDANCSAS